MDNKEKSKFFALYWDQLIGLGVNDQVDMNKHHFKAQSAFTEKIRLKRISSIKDEDAIKLGFDSASNFLEFESRENISEWWDELRYLGYATRWMNYSIEDMIEAGWIELI